MKRSLLLSLALLFTVGFMSCETEEPELENEEELITTVAVTFSPVGGGDDVVFTFVDDDGDGPNPPVYTDGENSILAANTNYQVSLDLLNESESPAESITEEIEEEDEEHQFFFAVSSGLNLNVSYDDTDPNGNPIGLAAVAETGDASTGSLEIELRHEPNKNADGVASGDITNAGGETDVVTMFDVIIR